jgi:hypothetical protein
MIEDLILVLIWIWVLCGALAFGWCVVWVLDWFGIIDKDERL